MDSKIIFQQNMTFLRFKLEATNEITFKLPQQRMLEIALGSSELKRRDGENVSLVSHIDEICNCTLNKTQPYGFNRNGGNYNLNTL